MLPYNSGQKKWKKPKETRTKSLRNVEKRSNLQLHERFVFKMQSGSNETVYHLQQKCYSIH